MTVLIVYHAPGRRITLYDAKRDSEFNGTMIFKNNEESAIEVKSSLSRVIEKNRPVPDDALIPGLYAKINLLNTSEAKDITKIEDHHITKSVNLPRLIRDEIELFSSEIKLPGVTNWGSLFGKINFVPVLVILIKFTEWIWKKLNQGFENLLIWLNSEEKKHRFGEHFTRVIKSFIFAGKEIFEAPVIPHQSYPKVNRAEIFGQISEKYEPEGNHFNLRPKIKSLKNNITLPKLIYSPPAISLGRYYSRLSIVFLLIAFISFVSIIGPIALADFNLRMPAFGAKNHLQVAGVKNEPSPPSYNSYYTAEKDPIYPIREFRIVVPKINLESNIVDNVDPNIAEEYKEKLMYGVAHAKGSYLPGQDGPVFLFAHSTDTVFNIARFNAKFFSVRELENGDEILVYLNGREYKYVVNGKKVIHPEEIDEIRNANTGLVLATCWPPGTDWQRLIIFADPVSTSN